MRPSPNSIFRIHNPRRLKVLAGPRMTFSHLRENKAKHNFQDTLDSFCNCQLDIKMTASFFRHQYCKVINSNSCTLYKNVPWSKVSSFKSRLKLKKCILIYKKKVQVLFLCKFNIKNFCSVKLQKIHGLSSFKSFTDAKLVCMVFVWYTINFMVAAIVLFLY